LRRFGVGGLLLDSRSCDEMRCVIRDKTAVILSVDVERYPLEHRSQLTNLLMRNNRASRLYTAVPCPHTAGYTSLLRVAKSLYVGCAEARGGSTPNMTSPVCSPMAMQAMKTNMFARQVSVVKSNSFCLVIVSSLFCEY